MKLLIVFLLVAISFSLSTAQHEHDNACEAAKHECETHCKGNFQWRCAPSLDGTTVKDKRCECTSGESGPCLPAKEQCRQTCGNARQFLCKNINEEITTRHCYCGSTQPSPCTAHEQACVSQCRPAKVKHFECDGQEAKIKKTCVCAGGYSTKASIIGVLLAIVLLAYQ